MAQLFREYARYAVAPLACGGFIIFASYWSVAANGSLGPLTATVFVIVPLFFSAVSLPIALICCLAPRLRKSAMFVFVVSAIFLVVIPCGIRLGRELRRQGFIDLAKRSEPLVNAIKAYEKKYGCPPRELSAIVPEFLPQIPATGMAAYPHYTYRVVQKGYEDNPWMLEVFTPSGILNFDKFIYYPLQNYPRHWCGQPLEPIGDWVYLHE